MERISESRQAGGLFFHYKVFRYSINAQRSSSVNSGPKSPFVLVRTMAESVARAIRRWRSASDVMMLGVHRDFEYVCPTRVE